MRRRRFLQLAAAGALGWACRPVLGRAQASDGLLEGMTVIDMHAHPDYPLSDGAARIADLRPGGVSLACFAAVGDHQWSRGRLASESEHQATRRYLRAWLNGPVAEGRVVLARRAVDVPQPGAPAPGALLALEGGDPLEGRPERVDEYFELGVRLITLIHYRNNEIGDVMRVRSEGPDPGPFRHGLSRAGREIIARMETLGMIVDVAHAERRTLFDILDAARKPVVDSHTGPCRRAGEGPCGRLRTWEEMEAVTSRGGLVCSWSSGARNKGKGFAQWARDILEMRDRLGPEGIGLGTNSGGHLPVYVEGWTGWRDVPRLAAALAEQGMGREDMAAFFGGNALRIIRACLP